jgi:ribonuclease BN (tRNA processing enzyme)
MRAPFSLGLLLSADHRSILLARQPEAEHQEAAADGENGETDAGQRVLVPLLRALGEQLDRVIISHQDSDHSGGAPAVLAPQIKAGELRALVTTGTKRHALLPDTPTAIELGFKDVEFYLWVGLFASAKTDEALTRLIRRDIGRAVQEPEFVQLMNKLGAPIDYRDGPAFTAFLDKDEERIKAAINRIGKVD